MRNTTENISKLIGAEVKEFLLYSYSDKSIYHEYFATDKYSNSWCHDIYEIDEDAISEYGLYNEDNLNEYLTSLERDIEDDIHKEDILSRIYNSSKDCSIILINSAKDILEHFMKNKDNFNNQVLYAIIPINNLENNITEECKEENNKRCQFLRIDNEEKCLYYFNFKDNFDKWIEIISSKYSINLSKYQIDSLKEYLTETKEYESEGLQCFDSFDYFAFDINNGYIYKMSTGYDEESCMGKCYIDVIKSYSPNEYILLSDKEKVLSYVEHNCIENNEINFNINDGIPF